MIKQIFKQWAHLSGLRVPNGGHRTGRVTDDDIVWPDPKLLRHKLEPDASFGLNGIRHVSKNTLSYARIIHLFTWFKLILSRYHWKIFWDYLMWSVEWACHYELAIIFVWRRRKQSKQTYCRKYFVIASRHKTLSLSHGYHMQLVTSPAPFPGMMKIRGFVVTPLIATLL